MNWADSTDMKLDEIMKWTDRRARIDWTRFMPPIGPMPRGRPAKLETLTRCLQYRKPQPMNSYSETREHPCYVGRSYHGRQLMSIVKKSKFLITRKLYSQGRIRYRNNLRLCHLPIRVLQIANREIGVPRIGSGPLPAFRFSVLQTCQEFGEVFLPDRGLEKGVMAA